jgi:hypothetical protein
MDTLFTFSIKNSYNCQPEVIDLLLHEENEIRNLPAQFIAEKESIISIETEASAVLQTIKT